MGIGDDIANKAKEAVGKAKEGIGEATGNEKLEAQGVADQVAAKAEQVKDDAGDAAKKVGKDIKDAFK